MVCVPVHGTHRSPDGAVRIQDPLKHVAFLFSVNTVALYLASYTEFGRPEEIAAFHDTLNIFAFLGRDGDRSFSPEYGPLGLAHPQSSDIYG